MPVRRFQILTPLCAIAFAVPTPAQTSPPQSTAGQPGYTLHTSTRIVLTDVTVTDSHGNPIHGLDRSAFRIFDNNRPQPLSSFEEHVAVSKPEVPTARAAKNVFSNDLLLHPPPVFNVIVLDTTTLNVVDQMYLNEELTHFVKTLPPDQLLAIYDRAKGGFTILLQDFTADHDLLLSAIQKAIPRLQQFGIEFASDFDTLHQIAQYLGQYPGRKNVLWFSGGSNLFLQPDPSSVPGPNLQPVYDELEAARIAIYPIDARGLMISTRGGAVTSQHLLMEDIADATGGRAIFNTNGLADATSQLVNTDASFYTLTYAPHDLTFNNKWHKIKVKVDGGTYVLSYRRGYYDDAANLPDPPEAAAKPRTLLRAGGEKTQLLKAPGEPIIFQVSVLPSSGPSPIMKVSDGGVDSTPPQKGETAYKIHYSVPPAAFLPKNVDGLDTVEVGAGAVAFNKAGHPVARPLNKFILTFDDATVKANPHATLGFDQPVNLPSGDTYLYIAVWDIATGRLGTVQVPLNVPKPKKP